MDETGDVTKLLLEMRGDHGAKEATAKLFPLVYRELRRVAARYPVFRIETAPVSRSPRP